MSFSSLPAQNLPDAMRVVSRPGAPSPEPSTVPALWRLGFRPFYLLAATLACVAIPLWVASLYGVLPSPGMGWHAHEMVFGFAIAVIIGFLFTAGRNWTGLDTPRGAHLAALAGVWLAGRLALVALPPLPAAAIDLAFLPLAAWPLWRVFRRAGNKRNTFLIGLLAVLASANAAYHAATLGWLSINALRPVQGAILVIVLIETVIGGRVIPNFTANTIRGLQPVVDPRRDRIGVALLGATALGYLLGLPGPAEAGLAAAAAVAVATRALGYLPHRTLRHPLLWVLHLSYAWIAAGLLLLALASIGLVPSGAAFHALGVGATGGLVIGMLTRTALGHTARPLVAGKAEVLMYLALHAGALLRVAAALLPGRAHDALLVASATCWSASFLLYVIVYAPRLAAPRLDGKDG